jgi:Flp pilus assembly protein TadB
VRGAAAGLVVQRLGAREQRQQVHHVVFGVVVDLQVLVSERALQRVAEELPEVGHGDDLVAGIVVVVAVGVAVVVAVVVGVAVVVAVVVGVAVGVVVAIAVGVGVVI